MRLRSITREDLPEVAAITFDAFKDDELYTWINPNSHKYPDHLRITQYIRLRYRLVGRGQYGFVVVTEEGDSWWTGKEEVMGHAFYVRMNEHNVATAREPDTMFKRTERHLLNWEQWYHSKFIDRAVDPERMKKLLKWAPWEHCKSINPRWHVAAIAVSPRHQRRGVGGMLVQKAQELAAEEDMPLSLEASVAGRGLYSKMGFKKVHEVVISDTFADHIMVWEPTGLEGTWLTNIEGNTAQLIN